MRVAITGGTGYLGGSIVRALAAQGHTVRAMTRRSTDVLGPPRFDGVEWVQGDMLGASSLTDLMDGCQAFIHAGGIVRTSNPEDFQSNVDFAHLVLSALDTSGLPMAVLVSSGGVFGNCGVTVDENSPHRPDDAYERSKSRAESVLMPLVVSGRARMMRPAVIFGGSNPLRPLLRLSRRICSGRMIPVSLRACTNYVHVDDVARTALRLLEDPGAPDLVNVNYPLPLPGLVALLADALDTSARTIVVPAGLAELAARVPDNVVGSLPHVSLAKSIVDATRIDTQHPEWLHGEDPVEDVMRRRLMSVVDEYRRQELL